MSDDRESIHSVEGRRKLGEAADKRLAATDASIDDAINASYWQDMAERDAEQNALVEAEIAPKRALLAHLREVYGPKGGGK